MAEDKLPEILGRIKGATSWDERVEEIRRVPENFGQAQHQGVYAAIAEALYRPNLSAQFAYVQWKEDYSLESVQAAYDSALEKTKGFERVSPKELASVLEEDPRTVRAFRLILGYTAGELAATASEVAQELGAPAVTKARIDSMERGSVPSRETARACATAVDKLMTDTMWEEAPPQFSTKRAKPDTAEGWETVRRFATEGVPYAVLLHQRHYGGPFRNLLDATSTERGDLLENPVEDLFTQAEVPHVRTGRQDQSAIAERFNLTVKPAPDFVVYEGERTLRAILECKQANDGGTARDKAARFARLRQEGQRLGGVPVIAILEGLGWHRTPDALGPVVRDTDGRVFTLATLDQLLSVQPFPSLTGKAGER